MASWLRQSRRKSFGGGVFFEAALDAAQGQRWPVDRLGSESTAPALLATQSRHLERSGLLLGLSLDERAGEGVRDVLDVGGLVHEEARSAYSTRSLTSRGQGVLHLLGAVDAGRDDRLLAAGHAAGLWGRPYRIDVRTGRRHRLPWRDPPMNFALSAWSVAL